MVVALVTVVLWGVDRILPLQPSPAENILQETKAYSREEATELAFCSSTLDMDPQSTPSFIQEVLSIPETLFDAAQKWGGKDISWELERGSNNTGWKVSQPMIIQVEEGWRIDYTDPSGFIYTCAHEENKDGPERYGPIINSNALVCWRGGSPMPAVNVLDSLWDRLLRKFVILCSAQALCCQPRLCLVYHKGCFGFTTGGPKLRN